MTFSSMLRNNRDNAASLSGQNYSTVSEFILIGFSTFPQHLLPAFFLLYLLMYLFTLLGNLLIMATIWRERSLHTPMYLFLCALSISKILFTVAVTPRMLVDMLSTHRSISFTACASQMFFSFTALLMAISSVLKNSLDNAASLSGQNYSTVSEFILIGFSTFPQHLLPAFFLLYLLMYLFTLLGNLLIMATIWSEHSLHTPMYLFLCALSISEILFTVAVTPRMLVDMLSIHHSISFTACASQMFFSFTFGFTHSFLLMIMGYDRYVAICHPLRYNVLMSPGGCARLVSWSWAGGSVVGMMLTLTVFHLTFSLLGCLFLIVLSYVFIVAAILRIPSAEGRHKTFSTCVSHLTIVIVHYGFASIIYLKPKGPRSMDSNTLMATTYTVFTPFLSPIIFSLRNKELKNP
ncbi:Olfactory receptor 10H4 [Camelus dromedarius]|uniref:Olfactory receptor 10H4 n=1 Tax=Camelus dromedarius TaxID=9838 RepID=A0A5N4CMH9_CAMDR|nr:Olfactory receptor 10H4 [Camelus dromedarius]